jgi:hypothetical protein
LVNTIENPTSVIQNLSDFKFYLTPSLNTGTLVSSAGLERTVASNGTFTNGSVVDTGWQLETGDGLRVHVLGTPTGPAHTIIGLPDSGTNTYSNANNSIAGNGPHNPFLAGPVVFDITISGLTSSDTVTVATFSFGTTEGNDVTVPEPTSMLLMGGIFAGLGAFRYRRRCIRQQVTG